MNPVLVKEKAQTPERTPVVEPAMVNDWPPPQGQWTYEDWLKLPDDGWQYEVIKGVLYMVPAPSPDHQRASRNLEFAMWRFAKEHDLGEVFYAPIDVYLPGQETPVQPDVVFVAKGGSATVSDRGIEGAPALVVEILSPRTWWRDRRVKTPLYEETGVQELWLLDANARTVEVYGLKGQTYALLGQWGPGEQARSQALKGFVIDVDEIMP
ncbi:MAG: Uma2 family endonuclease [Chloroflexi bacterium]|nr:Uma2 family endonuclease [Chloroflexota bacterium]